MTRGDRVRVCRTGFICRVLQVLDGGDLVVETDDGPKRYAATSVRAVGQSRQPRPVSAPSRATPPRAVTRATPRDLEVARLRAEGVGREAIAQRMGLSVSQVQTSVARAAEAIEEARAAAALQE